MRTEVDSYLKSSFLNPSLKPSLLQFQRIKFAEGLLDFFSETSVENSLDKLSKLLRFKKFLLELKKFA